MPTSGTWVDLAAQSLTHAFVAALGVEALLRLWGARAPVDRLAARLVGLAQPLVVTPALFFLVPARTGDDYGWALFSARHWSELEVGPIDALQAWVGLGALLGAALLMLDVVPLLTRRRQPLPAPAATPPALTATLSALAADLRVAAPRVRFLDARGVALYCAGVRRPTLVISQGALELLDPAELRAALAHELAHLRRGDPTLSWLLLLVRALLWFNPVVQVVARAVAREAEWCADEQAHTDRLALASAVLKLHRAGQARPVTQGGPRPLSAALSNPLRRIRSHDVASRCRRLLEPEPPERLPFGPARLALASAALAGLAFLST